MNILSMFKKQKIKITEPQYDDEYRRVWIIDLGSDSTDVAMQKLKEVIRTFDPMFVNFNELI